MFQVVRGLACSKSSKSRAASFFILLTLSGKLRIAESDEPNDGTLEYLYRIFVSRGRWHSKSCILPPVKLTNMLIPQAVQYSYQMREDHLEEPKFHFMKKVHAKDLKKIETVT